VRRFARFLPLLLFVMVCAPVGPRAQQNPDMAACQFIQQALTAHDHLKVGGTRRDVGNYFTEDGGMQFKSPTRYVYPTCRYLKVDIEFDVTKPADPVFSPEDKVTKISKLYVEYPFMD